MSSGTPGPSTVGHYKQLNRGWNLKKFLGWCRGRILARKDLLIIIVGEEGDGKSTFAFQLGWMLDQAFGADRMLFGSMQFIRMAQQRPPLAPGSVLVMDEAVEGGYSKDAMSTPNKSLGKFVIIFRKLRLVTVLCWPRLQRLNAELKERAHGLFIIREEGGRRVARFYKRARINQWSKKGPSFEDTKWDQPFEEITPKHPGYKEWLRAQERNFDAISTFDPESGRMTSKAVGPPLADRLKRILKEEGVAVTG